MNKLLSTVAFVSAISLALPASAGTLCGTITDTWSGWAANWTGTPGNAAWFVCSDNSAHWASVGANGANETSISNLIGQINFAKALQCPVWWSGSNDSGLTGVQCAH